jgi:hypothetical protein
MDRARFLSLVLMWHALTTMAILLPKMSLGIWQSNYRCHLAPWPQFTIKMIGMFCLLTVSGNLLLA